MLPKKYRGINKKEIGLIFKKGGFDKINNLMLRFVKNNLNHPRFTLIAGINYSKKAVERNKAKKCLATDTKELLEKIKNYDIALILNRKEIPKEEELKKNIEKMLKRNNLIK